MSLTRLTLTDFRSYATAALEPGPGFVVLTGDNGAGKTNILEALVETASVSIAAHSVGMTCRPT